MRYCGHEGLSAREAGSRCGGVTGLSGGARGWGLVVVAGVVAGLLGGCGGKPEAAPIAPTALTVELVSATHAAWSDEVVASGEVAPWQEAIIGAEISNTRLDEVLVNVGDVVRKGQLLAHYNEDALRQDLARQDAAVAEAQANLGRAKADLARAVELEDIGATSKQAVETYHSQVEVAEAQLASTQAQRGAQQLLLRYARVIAPDDGTISSRTATVGSVSVIGAELFRLVRRDRLEWRAEIPAAAVAKLKPGMTATIRTPNGEDVSGKLRQLSPIVDAATRNGLAYVDLPNGHGLSAGMYASGRFEFTTRDALIVPESAVVMRDGNHYLMKVDEQNRVHELKVTTGRRQRNAIEIVSGLAAADQVVKSGGSFISDGDLVQIAPAAPAAAAAP